MKRIGYISVFVLISCCYLVQLGLFGFSQGHILPGLTAVAEDVTGGGNAPGVTGGGNAPGVTGGGNAPGRQVYKTLPNPLGSQTMTIGSIPQIVNKIINAILTIIGAIALLVVIYGGFMWMTSAGNENRVAKGKSTLMWAAIALAIIFLAWILVGFLFQALGV